MKSKLFLIVLAFITGACNLSKADLATTTAAPAPAVEDSPAPIFTSAPTLIPVVEPTSTPSIIPPTPTLTLFYMPTMTSTPSLSECPLIITLDDTKSGDFLRIRRCEDNLEYSLGPFAKGVYAVGPNHNFLVYVTNSGLIYGARIGETYLVLIKDAQKGKVFTALNKGAPPNFAISFTGEAPYYKLALTEKKFEQQFMYNIPLKLVE